MPVTSKSHLCAMSKQNKNFISLQLSLNKISTEYVKHCDKSIQLISGSGYCKTQYLLMKIKRVKLCPCLYRKTLPIRLNIQYWFRKKSDQIHLTYMLLEIVICSYLKVKKFKKFKSWDPQSQSFY